MMCAVHGRAERCHHASFLHPHAYAPFLLPPARAPFPLALSELSNFLSSTTRESIDQSAVDKPYKVWWLWAGDTQNDGGWPMPILFQRKTSSDENTSFNGRRYLVTTMRLTKDATRRAGVSNSRNGSEINAFWYQTGTIVAASGGW
jgi:hypothetical protein